MTLDSDVVLVAEERDAPYFFLVRAAVEAWDARGGVDGPLGLPTSNPLVIEGAFRQYFQSGYMEILNSTGEIVYVEVEDLAADLPDLGSLSGKLLRQSDATAWLITDDLTRKWIPDGLTFACLVGDPEFAATDVPGYAIATIEYAGVATCRDAVGSRLRGDLFHRLVPNGRASAQGRLLPLARGFDLIEREDVDTADLEPVEVAGQRADEVAGVVARAGEQRDEAAAVFLEITQ